MASLTTETVNVTGDQSNQKLVENRKKHLKAQELKIIRALSCMDNVPRYRALKSLKQWFRNRSKFAAFTEQDFQKIWGGLYLTMYMSDMPLVQEECAETISNLIHELSLEDSLVFFKCGLQILCKEWYNIGHARNDKFCMFVRRLLRHALIVLKKDGFRRDIIIKFGDILSETVLDTRIKLSLNLFLHFTDIFLEELAKVSEGELKPHLVTDFVEPFIKTFAKSNDKRIINRIRKSIFVHLMFQSDVGLEYQERYNAWKQHGFPGTLNSIKKVEIDDGSDVEEEENEHVFESKPLDPRAGRVDVELPQIKFNPKVLADLLIKHKNAEKNNAATRKAMTQISEQLRTLAKGTYPLGVKDLRLPKQEDTNIRKAVNRLVKFEKKINKGSDESKKRKAPECDEEPVKKKIKSQESEFEKKINNGSDESKKRKVPECDEEPVKKKIKSQESENKCDNVDNSPVKRLCSTDISEEQLKLGIHINGDLDVIKKKIPYHFLSETGEIPEMVFEKFSGLWKVFDDTKTSADRFLKVKKIGKKIGIMKTTKSKNNEIFEVIPWDESRKRVQGKIPSKSYVNKLKKITKNSSKNLQELLDSSLIKFKSPPRLSRNAQCSTPERRKKVQFDTSLNRSQEFDDYYSHIMTSPDIVYDATKKPGKPLLKTSSCSPIDPFYRKYKPSK